MMDWFLWRVGVVAVVLVAAKAKNSLLLLMPHLLYL
jgi:hypothetical protein